MVPYIDNQHDIDEIITRKEFEQCLSGKMNERMDYLSSIDDMIQNTLTNANTSQNEINVCILHGGSSRIPIIRNLLCKYFKNIMLGEDNSIANGAALCGAYQFYGYLL